MDRSLRKRPGITATMGMWAMLLGISGHCHAQFSSANMELMAHVPNVTGETSFDLWGWTDQQTGFEYALIGHTAGVDFYDLTNPYEPDYLGRWDGDWGFDVKVYDHYAYSVNGGTNGAMRIFDLTNLRGITTPQAFSSVSSYSPSFHNIFINETTGYLYGSSGYVQVVDLSDPLNPVAVHEIYGGGHDAMSVVYTGPDTRYANREILFASQEQRLGIYDVDDKSAVTQLSDNTYPGRNYVHQGWLSEDQRFFFVADELDSSANGARTHVFDVVDLEAPQYLGYYAGVRRAIDHNLYVKGNLLYLANYTAGVRVIRLDDPATLDMTEIASLDTYPEGNAGVFNGAFTVYPFFESGVLIASDMSRGLFVMKLDLGNDVDFNDDGNINCQDIDALVSQVANATHDIAYDLTDDGLVTAADLQAWLAEAGTELIGPDAVFLPGDANLDGFVDVSDFNNWNEHRFAATPAWCHGDWNADGVVDVIDLNLWNGNKFQSAGAAAVPEPTSMLLLIAAAAFLTRHRRAAFGKRPRT